jgi:hypothetical protein
VTINNALVACSLRHQVQGYLMQGNDIDDNGTPRNLTIADAKHQCASNPWCAGFTFNATESDPQVRTSC